MIFRTIITWGLGIPVTLVLFVFALIGGITDPSGKTVHKVGTLWVKAILMLAGVKVEVRGLENIPAGTVILASNHRGTFDIPVLQANLPVPFHWVAKKGLFDVPIIGWTMRLAGYVPIHMDGAAKAFRSISDASEKLKAGTSLFMFPEGTRNVKDELLPFKRGCFMLAVKSGVPIVPIAISGTRDIMRLGGVLIRPATARLYVGELIPSKGPDGPVDERELKEKTRAAIEKGLSIITADKTPGQNLLSEPPE
ncbi:MAG: lysophospholipid acyltransferase family protein [Thermodesulfobacteriota bacterium]